LSEYRVGWRSSAGAALLAVIAVAVVLTVIYRRIWIVVVMATVVGLLAVLMRRQPTWRFDEHGIHAGRDLVIPWVHAARVERRRTGLLRQEVLVMDPPFKLVGLGAITFVPLGALNPEWRNTDIGAAIDRWGPGTS
jgi:hypothetical protein